MRASLAAWLLLCAGAASLSTRVFAGPVAVPSAPSRIEICAAANVICAILVTEPFNKTLVRKGYRWGGEDVEPPQTVVSQLTVVVGGHDVFVPLSAFADLGSPRTVEVKVTRRGFDLIIAGGDASASYRALLAFQGRELTRRKVQHGEFPKEAWEDTRYKFNRSRN
jgi:hypothetical protein